MESENINYIIGGVVGLLSGSFATFFVMANAELTVIVALFLIMIVVTIIGVSSLLDLVSLLIKK
jgi:hypothetical protein